MDTPMDMPMDMPTAMATTDMLSYIDSTSTITIG